MSKVVYENENVRYVATEQCGPLYLLKMEIKPESLTSKLDSLCVNTSSTKNFFETTVNSEVVYIEIAIL